MYVMTLSVAPIVQLHCCMMNYEVERMWKEAVVAKFDEYCCPGLCIELRQTSTNLNQGGRFYFLWRISSARACAASFLTFLDHTQ